MTALGLANLYNMVGTSFRSSEQIHLFSSSVSKMWRALECFSILVSFTLVGGYMLYYIQEDYCELYLNASKISDRICLIKNDVIITNEYELKLVDYNLSLKWSQENLTEWNTVAVATEMKNLSTLEISGIRSSEDPRLRPASVYLNKLNLEHVKEFKIITEHFQIKEFDIHYKEGPTALRIDFNGSVNLGPINDYVAASTKRIRDFSISGLHLRYTVLCNYFQFFSLPELQENVENLLLKVDMAVNMKCFENYHRLKYILFDGSFESFENLTALVCNPSMLCNFTIGTNGLRCPADCECSHQKYNFQVNCSNRNLTQMPPIPIPIDGDIGLHFSDNLLKQLPNNTLPGYIDIVSLDVSQNKITSIGIHQLPRKLKVLNISDNPIKTVDSRVANYIRKTNIVYQGGIKWNANCDEKHLLKLFHKISEWINPIFEQLNGRCPRRCTCCFDRTSENFLINCTNRKKYPQLPNYIPNKVTLLLVNCSIRDLPKNLPSLLITHNITNLDLRNNSLRSLDGEVVNFYNNHNDTTIKLSRNPWTCGCKDKSFLFFLKSRDPLEFGNALDRCNISQCPEGCICCLESSDSSALTVDCRSQRLTSFPLLLDTVTSLDLRNNLITEINLQSQTLINNVIPEKSLQIFLSGNPWKCTCDLLVFVKNISAYVADYAELDCSNLGKRFALVEKSEICPSYFIYPVLLVIFILIMTLALNAIIYFKQFILMWFYEHEICMSMAVRLEMESMKKFDAFLSFTHKDENLVEEYVERLENGQRKFHLSSYLRDWQVGASIPECIIQSVKDSRRIIILMTKNFLESTWGKLEFRLALHATSKDRCKRLIVILYPDVENFDDLDSELKAYMVLNTYLRRDSPNFWNKLIYSMSQNK